MSQDREENWFNVSLNRRDTAKLGIGVAAVASIAGCSDGSKVEEMDSIAAQKKGGWDVGDTGLPLIFPTGVKGQDSLGTTSWQTKYNTPTALLSAIKPNEDVNVKDQMPTLVQSLGEKTLASKMKPVSNVLTTESYKQASAIGSLLAATKNGEKTVLVVDVPTAHGPAVAAGMAANVEPVFKYDNWPHPKGVVKSQDTLGALMYYAAELDKKKGERKGKKTPTAYMLDSTRLNDGKDPSATSFDNRYFVDLPGADTLKKRGVENVMYVTLRNASKETDDINDSLAEYKDKGLKVSNIALENFKPDPTYTPPKGDGSDRARNEYYYYGSHRYHTGFYHHYPMFIYYPGPRYSYWGSSVVSRSAMPARMRAPSYAPTRRPTKFSSRATGGAKGVGRSKPAGFGRVSTRVSKSGRIMGTKTGSVGRFRSGRSGGG